MGERTTVKVRKSTSQLLKHISELRGRRETQEQVILALAAKYMKEATNE